MGLGQKGEGIKGEKLSHRQQYGDYQSERGLQGGKKEYRGDKW